MPRGQRGRDGVLERSAELIGWALGGLEREIENSRERLATLTAQADKLRARLGQRARGTAAIAAAAVGDTPVLGRRRRRRMSREARRRISEAMRKKWAERRRAKGAR